MKRGVIFASLIGLALTQFVSAAFYNSGFNFGGLFVSLDYSTFVLFTLFAVFYALLQRRVFGKMFSGAGAVSVVLSLLISFAAVWGLATYIDLDNLLYNTIGENIGWWIFGIILALAIIFGMRSKGKYELKSHFSFSNLLIVAGMFIIFLGVSGLLFQEGGAAFIMGAGLFLLGLIIKKISKKKDNTSRYPSLGRSSPSRWDRAKRYATDPRYRLNEYKRKEAIRQQKRDARRQIRDINRKNIERFDAAVSKPFIQGAKGAKNTYGATKKGYGWASDKFNERKLRKEQKRRQREADEWKARQQEMEKNIQRKQITGETQEEIKRRQAEEYAQRKEQKRRQREADEQRAILNEQIRIEKIKKQMDQEVQQRLAQDEKITKEFGKAGNIVGQSIAEAAYKASQEYQRAMNQLREKIRNAKEERDLRRAQEEIRMTEIAREKKMRLFKESQRSAYALMEKYKRYAEAAEKIVQKVGHIPEKDSPYFKEWHNYYKAVRTIEEMAKKRGIKLY